MKLIFIVWFTLSVISCSGNKKSSALPAVLSVAVQDSLDKGKIDFKTLKFETDGKTCLAVINNRYAGYQNKKAFPLSVFITVSTVDQDKNGHPTRGETAEFTKLHDEILNTLDALNNYCYIGNTTMTGYRDIMLYIKNNDEKEVTRLLNLIKSKNKRFTKFVYEKDENWEAVAGFYEAIK